MALVALVIKARLRVADEEGVEQIEENSCHQYFLGFEGFKFHVPCEQVMVVSVRHRLPETIGNSCNWRAD